jgi:transposase
MMVFAMRKSRLSWSIQRRLIEHFVSGSTARTAACLVDVNKSTAAFYFQRLREIIALQSEDTSPLFGEIEVDESYFGGHRKGKRGRGAGGKIPVFGLLKRGGKVYAKVIPDSKGKTLKAIIEDKVVPDSIVYSDTFRSYDVLDISNFKHLRINHSELFSDHSNHINGIENFWNQAKRHMRRFNGIPAAHFHLYLKECEWRFNSPQPKKQQAQLIQWAKTYLR